jgi:MFS superfamily sulfate permease-like transporter
MMNITEMKRLFRLRRTDFWLAIVALFAVLTFEILMGLAIAVTLSLLVLIGRAAMPKFSIIGRAPGRLAYGDVQRHPDYQTMPGLMLVRPNEEVWFANATPLREKIIAQVQRSDQKIRTVLLDLDMTYELDIPSLDMLVELKEELERYDVTLSLAKVHDDVQELLERSGVIDAIGEENISQSITEGILEYMETRAEFSPEEAQHILKVMPHSLDLLSLAASLAVSEEERARIEAVRDRFEKTTQDLSAADDVTKE